MAVNLNKAWETVSSAVHINGVSVLINLLFMVVRGNMKTCAVGDITRFRNPSPDPVLF